MVCYSAHSEQSLKGLRSVCDVFVDFPTQAKGKIPQNIHFKDLNFARPGKEF